MSNVNMLDGLESRMLVALRVAFADAETCAAKLSEMSRRIDRAQGFRGLDVIRREGGLGVDFFVLARFDTLESLEAWKTSPERRAMLDEIESLAIEDVARQQAAGGNIWFEPISSLSSTPPPPLFWKRWAVSMLAVYPALVVLFFALQPLTSQVPVALGLLVVATILTGITTAYIVPYLTRRLGPWLARR